MSCSRNVSKTWNWFLMLFGMIYLFTMTPSWAVTFYVDDDTATGGDGQSWATAYQHIQDAVDAASEIGSGDVWVAGGTYFRDGGCIIDMRENVHLYGGFCGGETAMDQRDWIQNPTVLDGEYKGVVVGGESNSTLDGFVVIKGAGYGINISDASPVIANCLIKNTWGIGIRVYTSNPDLLQVSSPVIKNCLFTGNVNRGVSSAIYNAHYSSSEVYHCIFTGNISPNATVFSYTDSMIMEGCVLWGNSSGIAGEEFSVTYSCVQEEYPGVGNISEDPLLLPETYRLSPASPCIDAGNPQASDFATTDFSGGLRIKNGRIDMGAYEEDSLEVLVEFTASLLPELVLSENPQWRVKGFQWLGSGEGVSLPPGEYELEFTPVSHWEEPVERSVTLSGASVSRQYEYTQLSGNYCWYVDVDALGANNGSSWHDAFTEIQPAIDRASQDGFGEVWIAEGLYTGDGENVLQIQNGVSLYGGFSGEEISRNQRHWADHRTVIDGENTRRCIRGEGSFTLDGVIIERGKALEGAGVYYNESFPTIENCIVRMNTGVGNDSKGGGIYSGKFSFLRIQNCLVVDNDAYCGRNIYNSQSWSEIDHCTFVADPNYSYSCCGISTFSTITNSIIWDEKTDFGWMFARDSCIRGANPGDNIIRDDPMLDYFYQPMLGSPCIDAGDSESLEPGEVDLLGNPRVVGSETDMGAYELVSMTESSQLTVTLGPVDTLSSTARWRLADGPWLESASTIMVEPGSYHIEFSTVHGWFKPGVSTITVTASETEKQFFYDQSHSAPVVYVDVHAGGSQDGSSWDNAFTEIQHGVEYDFPGGSGEVWVAEGIYTGTSSQVVEMKPFVSLYGGFTGGETLRDQRDWELYQTVIDGQEQRTCVRGAGQSTLDGFVVANGRAINGAGMFNMTVDVVVRNCVFTDNLADENGGAIYSHHSSDAFPSISHCGFLRNKATKGGGLYCDGLTGDNFLLDQNYFIENEANHGGGIQFNHPGLTMTRCHFDSNRANNDGAAISVIYPRGLSRSYFISCSFKNNWSGSSGGAVYIDQYGANFEISDCTFESNTSQYDGGGIHHRSPDERLLIRDCFFDLNEAGHDGGAVYTAAKTASVISCLFTKNKAARLGGAIGNMISFSDRNIEKSIFIENQAGYGGAVCIYSFQEEMDYGEPMKSIPEVSEFTYRGPDIFNCLFVRNSAESYGDGIYNYSTRSHRSLPEKFQGNGVKSTLDRIMYYYHEAPVVKYCTFIQRSGDRAIDSHWPYEHFTSTYSDSYQTIVTHQIFHEPTVSNCIIWHEGDTDHNPGFRNPSDDDYRLTAQSMYIDAGEPEHAPYEDLRGFPRPNGELPDLGAYEFYDTAYPPEIVFTLLDIITGKDIYDLNSDGLIDAADLMVK